MGGLGQTHDSLLGHVTKKLLVELTDIIHIGESNIKHKVRLILCSLLHPGCVQPTWIHINRICCQVSQLSNTQRKHLSRVWNRAYREYTAELWHICQITVFVHLVLLWQFVIFQGWNPHLIKFYRICLNFVPLTSQSKKCKVERNDGDIYGGTEIEMSNYPAILTHIGLSSCGQTVQHLLCCHCRALWDRISFIKPHKSEHVK